MIRDTLHWAEEKLERAGDRPLVADRDRLGDRGELHGHRHAADQSPARRPNRRRATTCVYSTKRVTKERPTGKIGSIVVKLPLPPGCLPTLWNNDKGFQESYLREYPGYYTTADAGYCDEDGYVYIMARTDDIINVAGHRLSTGGMEEVLASHKDVAECAVLGVADQLKGEIPVGFVVLKAGVETPEDQIVKELVQLVREKIGPVAAFKTATIVKRLPKTRSGKILRGTIKKIADGTEWSMPATIDEPAILDEITDALKGIGYPKQAVKA